MSVTKCGSTSQFNNVIEIQRMLNDESVFMNRCINTWTKKSGINWNDLVENG